MQKMIFNYLKKTALVMFIKPNIGAGTWPSSGDENAEVKTKGPNRSQGNIRE